MSRREYPDENPDDDHAEAGPLSQPKKARKKEDPEEEGEEPEVEPLHNLVGLNCEPHGGPSNEAAAEMVYWEDIPSDNKYVSPFKKQGETQYITFEADHGGWNNIRVRKKSMNNARTFLRLMYVVLPRCRWNL